MRERKIIGIIGGMGPLASCDLYKKIILNTKATCDKEHVRVLIDSNTQIHDRTNAILYGGESPLPMLVESARKLQDMGAGIIIIACNTSHYYIDEIRKSVKVKVISIVEATLETVRSRGIGKIVLLATEGTVKSRIYQKVFEKSHIEILVPDSKEQEIVTDIIYKGVKAGNNNNYNAQLFQQLIQKKELLGAQAIVLGCTELPIAITRYHLRGNFIDPSLELARSSIRAAGGEAIELNLEKSTYSA